MTRLLPSVLTGDDLPLPELCAARLDGELFAIDECFSPVDEVQDATARAAALRSLVGDRGIAERASALWIYGILTRPPPVHTLCVARENRSGLSRTMRTAVRETRLQAGDTLRIGGMAVTTPVRTAFDLLRTDLVGNEEFGDVERSAIRALFARFGLSAADARARINDFGSLPGRNATLDRLESLAAARPLSLSVSCVLNLQCVQTMSA